MLTHIEAALSEAEQRASHSDARAMMAVLRTLCLDDYAEISLNMPDARYPHVSALLPRMASEEVQRNWTGDSGYPLLRLTLAFVRGVWHWYERITKRGIGEATILDYGCGYGRHLRLMRYFIDDDRLFGCDPWDKSIELCKASGISCDLQVTDYLPTHLPYAVAGFDLIYAFSVFTHLSARAASSALRTLRHVIRDDGVLVITVRPLDYWAVQHQLTAGDIQDLQRRHHETGFAFRPHLRAAVDGDITFGDTSMSPEYIAGSFPDWKVSRVDRSIDDPYQRIVYLRPH